MESIQPSGVTSSPTVHLFSDRETLSRWTARTLREYIHRKPDLLLAAPTGSTPTRAYELLAQYALAEPEGFSKLRLLKIDEWGGLAMDDPATCETYLQQHLVSPLGISPERYIAWNSRPADPLEECQRIAGLLRKHGPIDLCMLGVGANGHLAFNEPADTLQAGPHVAKLTEESMNHPMLKATSARPAYGLTIGMLDILNSREILLLVSGAHKAAQLKRLMEPVVSPQFPASLLHVHPNVSVAADRDAARLLNLDDSPLELP